MDVIAKNCPNIEIEFVDINKESQPFNLESSWIIAVFNGEIYNYKDLRLSKKS